MKKNGMISQFYPDEWVDSTFEIDYEKLYKKGFRGILFDIDNTLVQHDAPADSRAGKLLQKLKRLGFRICLVSNNKEKRVKKFAKELGIDYVFQANKPSRKGFRRAMNRIGTTIKNTVSIGDQVFTDVFGSNRAGLYSILVKPIAKTEEIQIVFKRYLERIILFFYKKQLQL